MARVRVPWPYLKSLSKQDQERLRRNFDELAKAIEDSGGTASLNGIYGDGFDGTVNFDGSSTVLGLVPSAGIYTMTRDIYLASGSEVSGSAILHQAGFRVFCNGSLTVDASAMIDNTARAIGSPIDTGPGTIGNGLLGNSGSNSVVAPSPGTALANALGGSGGDGGAATGGGSGGGVCLISAAVLINNGTIAARGQNGFAATGTGNAGGGGGGGGGSVIIICGSGSTVGTTDVSGGSGGGPIGTGATGLPGLAGNVFTLIG